MANKPMTVRTKINNLLKRTTKRMTPKQIATKLGLNHNSVRREIRILYRSDLMIDHDNLHQYRMFKPST